MTTLRALVSLPNASSTLPRDAAVNTFHFNSSSPAATAASAHTALTTFYNAIDGLLSSVCGTTATVKYYDLADAEPRTPIYTNTIALTVGSGVGLPNECAIAMSYRADLVSGQPPARRRGRIYLGPLDADDVSTVAGDMRPTSPIRTSIANAAKALAEATITSSTGWVVFSPTSAGPSPWSEGVLDASSFVVTAGWVDDACDTVRSRGLAATTRTSWVAV